MFKNKKTFFALTLLFSFACVVYVSQAGTAENGSGWLGGWSDTNLGWISTNNTNIVGSTVSYGINVPMTDGPLSGYAWSENVGWIDFAPVGPYPTAPSYSAQRTGDVLDGWARISSIRDAGTNAGGWLGWIKLSGAGYGVSINTTVTPNTLNGYAWSDELGWIKFDGINGANGMVITSPKTIIGSASVSPMLVPDAATPVSVTISVTGGTATGNNIQYELDCTSDGTFEKTYSSTTGELSHAFTDACSGYTANSTAKARITRDGVSTVLDVAIFFGCMDSVCNPTTYVCESQLKTSGCTFSCNATNCKKPVKRSLNWREVSPN